MIPVAYLILTDGPLLWILILIALAVASDYFDGRLARWYHTVSDWGKVLDPLADKIGGGLVATALMIKGSLPVWFLVVILSRDVLIMLGGELLFRKKGIIVMSLLSGKIAVTSVAITILAALLQADPPVMQFCLTASTVILGYSFLRYLARLINILQHPDEAPASGKTN